MADVTICMNDVCPQKYNCYRHTAMPALENQQYQIYIFDLTKKPICGYFIERVYPPDKEELN